MYSLLVSSGLSEMSPDAPGRMAYTGRGRAPGYPELMYTRPFFSNGDGMVSVVMPLSCHSSFPSRSYERTLTVPAVTISVRNAFSHTSGVDQLPRSSRLTLQASAPVRLSNATRNDCVVLSLTT